MQTEWSVLPYLATLSSQYESSTVCCEHKKREVYPNIATLHTSHSGAAFVQQCVVDILLRWSQWNPISVTMTTIVMIVLNLHTLPAIVTTLVMFRVYVRSVGSAVHSVFEETKIN